MRKTPVDFDLSLLVISVALNLLYWQAFAELLKSPREDAEAIIHERFPVPRLVICDQYGSQVTNYAFYLVLLNVYIYS